MARASESPRYTKNANANGTNATIDGQDTHCIVVFHFSDLIIQKPIGVKYITRMFLKIPHVVVSCSTHNVELRLKKMELGERGTGREGTGTGRTGTGEIDTMKISGIVQINEKDNS